MSHSEQTKLRRTGFVGAYIEPEVAAQLVTLARKQDRSVSSLIRRAVSEHLDRERARSEP